jgi:outer membrane protein assembly factor BamD (BamD/ComL family)
MYNKNMKKKTASFFVIVVLGFCAGCATLSETADRYRQSVLDIQEGRPYFAAISLKAILKDDPQSPYAPAVAFALGEYYFDNTDYFNALKTFSDYIHSYPRHKGVVFARLIVYKIIMDYRKEEIWGQQQIALVNEIRKELFSQPLFLIFYDKKSPRSYKSMFHNSYLVYDYVDKIKVFRNDKVFLELSP